MKIFSVNWQSIFQKLMIEGIFLDWWRRIWCRNSQKCINRISGDTADFRQRSEENFKGAKMLQYMDFSVDLSECVNEVAAVTNIYNEYINQIASGQASETDIQEYIEKLYNSDVQKILDTYQAELDVRNTK